MQRSAQDVTRNTRD